MIVPFFETKVAVLIMTICYKTTKSIINLFYLNIIHISNNDNNDIELYRKTKIEVYKRFFNLIRITNKYVKRFIFGEDYL